MRRAANLILRLFSGTLTVVLAVLLGCNLYVIGARFLGGVTQPEVFGYSTAVVVSGSMSGSIEVNDMVVIRRSDSYQTGDVISFESGSNLVTHRIVERTAEGFITKGDANNTPDREPVIMDQIVGKVVLVIPGIGKILEYLRTPLGMTCLVLVGFALVEFPVWFGKAEEGTPGRKGGKYAKKNRR